MMRWQKPARVAVGAFGVACALLVYLTLGDRPQPAAVPPLERIDPNAVLESTAGVLEGLDEGFELRFATMATYDDGTTRLTGVRITAPDREGRSFVVLAGEAHETSGTTERRNWELQQDVRLQASDGFELATARGSYDEAGAVVRAAGAVSFAKGRMSGTGRGMIYDLDTDVLRVASDADVRFAGDDGAEATRVTAGSATLDRPRDELHLERDVRVADGDQRMRADRARAQLAPEGGQVTFVELRGRARVDGAPSVDAMQAAAIDLDYTEQGTALERVRLEGDATVSLVDGAGTRELGGQTIDVVFASDGSIGRVTGRTGVSMVLPASAVSPARRIESSAVEAVGGGGSLRDIRFEGEVVFREQGAGAPRVARADALAIAQAADGRLLDALFTGHAVFEDGALRARAARARYEPDAGVLDLSGTDARGEPSVEDDRVIIDANGITVALDARRVEAEGRVRTTLLADGGAPRAGAGTPSRRPGLLAADQAARITAGTLVYDGSAGLARYAGQVRLWQKETDVRADTMDIDLEQGDLVARGQARAVFAFASGRSEGEAHEIAYDDGARRLLYTAGPPQTGAAAPAPARVTGTHGDLRAARIAVSLDGEESRVTGLTADTRVEAVLDGRHVTGAHLEYRASDERYVVTGDAAVPVRVRLSDPCRELLGRTLIYSRTADTMHVDGRQASRTEATRGGACR